MITLAFSVLVFYFFSQVTQLSGFGGVNNLDLPGLVGNPSLDPMPLYYTTLVVSVVVFVGAEVRRRGRRSGWRCRACATSRRGCARSASTSRATGCSPSRSPRFVAAIAGLLSVWYNRRISPGSINLAQTIDVLIIAVIGGLYRLEGAWVGALRLRADRQLLARVDAGRRQRARSERFNTLIGLVFLVIVLLSPGGLIGLWEQGRDRIRRRVGEAAATRARSTSGPGAEGAPAAGTVK